MLDLKASDDRLERTRNMQPVQCKADVNAEYAIYMQCLAMGSRDGQGV